MTVDVPEARPSAGAWLEAMAAGRISSRELVEQTLAIIDRADLLVHAVVARDDEAALRAADHADALRAKGAALPLLGLPITIKDSLDVAGLPTTSGSLARKDSSPVSKDATVVARLRRAGAIPLLKTNVPELCSSYETDNLVHGLTRHPIRPEHTPGGSSGGEAALLGADASIVGIGTDGGGSIRVPSHYVGSIGLRPTVGRVPETGFWPETRSTGLRDVSCVGPMARHVDDLRLLLPIISGADGFDRFAVDRGPGDWSERDVTEFRVGWYGAHPAAPTTTTGTTRAVRAAAEALAARGCAVDEIEPSALGSRLATELFFALSSVDGGAQMKVDVAAAGGRHHPQFQALLDAAGAPLQPADVLSLHDEVDRYRTAVRGLFSRYDLVLSPVVAGPAPLHGQAPAGIGSEDYLQYRGFEYVHIVAVAGLPAVAVPVGEEAGMPVGVQVIAAPWREVDALAVARLLEVDFGGFAINRRLTARS